MLLGGSSVLDSFVPLLSDGYTYYYSPMVAWIAYIVQVLTQAWAQYHLVRDVGQDPLPSIFP